MLPSLQATVLPSLQIICFVSLGWNLQEITTHDIVIEGPSSAVDSCHTGIISHVSRNMWHQCTNTSPVHWLAAGQSQLSVQLAWGSTISQFSMGQPRNPSVWPTETQQQRVRKVPGVLLEKWLFGKWNRPILNKKDGSGRGYGWNQEQGGQPQSAG